MITDGFRIFQPIFLWDRFSEMNAAENIKQADNHLDIRSAISCRCKPASWTKAYKKLLYSIYKVVYSSVNAKKIIPNRFQEFPPESCVHRKFHNWMPLFRNCLLNSSDANSPLCILSKDCSERHPFPLTEILDDCIPDRTVIPLSGVKTGIKADQIQTNTPSPYTSIQFCILISNAYETQMRIHHRAIILAFLQTCPASGSAILSGLKDQQTGKTWTEQCSAEF